MSKTIKIRLPWEDISSRIVGQVGESALEWQRWFYVYPSYREQQRSDYRACVLRAAGQLPSNVDILSEKQFKALVTVQ